MAKGIHDSRYRQLLDAIIAARKHAGITQADLGAALQKSQQFVSKFESGERRLDPVEFVDIARALSVDPAALIAGVPNA